VAIGVTLGAFATGAFATGSLPPPVIGASPTHNMFFQVDTVVAGGAGVAVGCAQTNEFTVGQMVVFRVSGVIVPAGGPALTSNNVQRMDVTIPGVAQPIAFQYGAHGTRSFWTAAWDTTGYPNVGVVNFVITVLTKPLPATGARGAIPALTGRFSQAGMPPTSRLTINPAG